MEKCEQMQELISRLLDADLSAAERQSLAEHLETCAECRAVYEAFSSLSGELGGELEEPPVSLRENVMAELRREQIRTKNRRPWRYALSVAALAAVVIGVHFAAGNRMVADLAQSASITASAQPFEAAANGGSMMMFAAGEAAAEERVEGVEVLPCYDLGERSWDDFLNSVMKKTRSTASADRAPAESEEEAVPFAEVRLADGTILLCSRGGDLFAEEPETGKLVQIDLTKEQFRALFDDFLA